MGFVRLFLILILLGFSYSSLAAPAAFVYQGQIIKPDQLVLEASSVDFIVELYSPGGEECLLYQETHTINMTGSNGLFSLTIGSGSRSGTDFEDTTTLDQAIDNYSGSISPTTCVVGSTYNPNAGDARKLRVSFDDGTSSVTMSDQLIQSVPYAQQASTVGGIPAGNLLQINTGGTYVLTQANLENVFDGANHTELLALLGGTSSNYMLSTPTSSPDFNNQVLDGVATPVDGDDATNKNYVDQNLGGTTLDNTDLGTLGVGQAGEVLTWDGTKWHSTTIPSSGDFLADGSVAMTGNVRLNDNWLSNDGGNEGIRVDDSGNVGVGTATPQRQLHLSTSNAGTTTQLALENIDTTNGNGSVISFRTNTTGVGASPFVESAAIDATYVEHDHATHGSQLNFWTTGSGTLTNRMTINESGNVGIGTDAPQPFARLEVKNSSSTAEPWKAGVYSVTTTSGSSAASNGNASFNGYAYNGSTGAGYAYARLVSGTVVTANDAKDQNVQGYYVELETHNTDNAYGVLIADEATGNTTGGTQYGVYIALDDTDSTNYGIYQENSTSTNYFAGNVGLGATSPQKRIEIYNNGGAGHLDDISSTAVNDVATSASLLIHQKQRTTGGYLQTNDRISGVLARSYNGTNIGNGVQGNTSAAIEIFAAANHASDDVPGYIAFSTTAVGANDDTERMRIAADGNVGIGSDAPITALDVNGTVTATAFAGSGASLTGVTASSSQAAGNTTNYIIDADSDNNASGEIQFQSGGAQQIVMENNGDFVFYNDAGSTESIRMNVGNGAVNNGPDIQFDAQGLMASEDNMFFFADSDNDSTTDYFSFNFNDNKTGGSGSEVMRIQENGNVGIGTTSPGHFVTVKKDQDAETRLHVENFNASNWSAAVLAAHSEASQWLRMTSYPTTHISSSAGKAEIASGNANGLDIWSVTDIKLRTNNPGQDSMIIKDNGNVGIGTTTPGSGTGFVPGLDSKIHIFGLDTGTLDTALVIEQANGNAPTTNPSFWGIRARGTAGAKAIVSDGDSILNLVGSGFDGANYQQVARIDYEIDGTPGVGDMPGRMVFKTTPDGSNVAAERLRIDSSGKVGIGTTNPTSDMHLADSTAVFRIQDNDSLIGTVLGSYVDFADSAGTRSGYVGFGGLAQEFGISNGTNSPMLFFTNATERVRISSAGNVGIGSTNPVAKLDVAGEVKFGNTSSTCNATNEGQQRYNSTSKAMEFCDGSVWNSLGKTATSCPTGFTIIGDAGKPNSYCISTNEQTATTYSGAMDACHSNNTTLGRARLCSYQDWYNACTAGTPNDMTDDYEWIDQWYKNTSNYAWAAGSGSCTTISNTTTYTWASSRPYRCCLSF